MIHGRAKPYVPTVLPLEKEFVVGTTGSVVRRMEDEFWSLGNR